MFEVFNYRTGQTIAAFETEAEAARYCRVSAFPLDYSEVHYVAFERVPGVGTVVTRRAV